MESPHGAKATLFRTKLVFFPPVLPPLLKMKFEMLPLLSPKVGLALQIRPNLPDITTGPLVDVDMSSRSSRGYAMPMLLSKPSKANSNQADRVALPYSRFSSSRESGFPRRSPILVVTTISKLKDERRNKISFTNAKRE